MLKPPQDYPTQASTVEKARFILEYRQVDHTEHVKMCRYFVHEIASGRSPITGRSRNKTEQDVGTPPEFLRVTQEVFGRIALDLAASTKNHVCPKYYTKEDDGLNYKTSWPKYKIGIEDGILKTQAPWLWLNPPYRDIGPWLERCQAEKENGRNILVLIPASIGTKWWSKWVDLEDGPAWTSIGRMKFVGHTAPYPRDLALLIYSEAWQQGWRYECGLGADDLTQLGFSTPEKWLSNSNHLGRWDWWGFYKLLLDNA